MNKNQLLLRVLFALFICLFCAVAIAMYVWESNKKVGGEFPRLCSVCGTVEEVQRLDGELEIVRGHKVQRRYLVLTVDDLGADPHVTYEFTVTNETEYSEEPSQGDTVEVEFIAESAERTDYIARSVEVR